MRRLRLLAFASLLAACRAADPSDDVVVVETDADSDPTVVDADRDGSPATDDCDDHDPSVFPGAVELCDGVDQDCAPDDGARHATFFPLVGAPIDLTTALGVVKATYLTGSGTVRLCGGPWVGTLSTDLGTSVTVTGQPGQPTPVLFGGLAFGGDGVIEGVDMDHARVSGGVDASLVVEGSDVVESSLTVDGLRSLVLRDVTVHQQYGVWITSSLDTTSPTTDALVERATFDGTREAFSAAMQLTIRASAFRGGAGLGKVRGLTMEDTTSEGTAFAVAGTGVEAVLLRRVTLSAQAQSARLSDLASVTLEDLDVTTERAAPALWIWDVDRLDLRDSHFAVDPTSSASSLLVLDGGRRAETIATVEDCSFEGDATHVEVTGSVALTVLRSTFEGAGDSAIEARQTHDLVVRDSTFHGNDAGPPVDDTLFEAGGGAIYADLDGATVTLEGCAFSDDTATTFGGDVYVRGGHLVVSDSTFRGGRAAEGGALYLPPGDNTLTDVTITDTVADGAAVYVPLDATAVVTRGSYLRNQSTTPHGGAFATVGRTTFVAVDLGSGADDNTPDDLGWPVPARGETDGASYGTFTGICAFPDGCR